MEHGDLEWAGYCSYFYCDATFFSGEALELVVQTQEKYLNALLARQQTFQAVYLNLWKRLAEKLHRTSTEAVYSFGSQKQTDEEAFESLLSGGNKMLLFAYYLSNGMLAFYRAEYKEAKALLRKADENTSAVVGMMTNAQHNFYLSLALICSGLEKKLEPDSEKLAKLVKRVKDNQKVLHKYARHGPSNWMHKVSVS